MSACNRYAESIVHMACRRSDFKIVEYIIHHEGDINLVDDFGRTPLHDACWRVDPRFDILTLLLDANIDLLRVHDSRLDIPLKYVAKDQWVAYCAYFFHQKDRYWPSLLQPKKAAALPASSSTPVPPPVPAPVPPVVTPSPTSIPHLPLSSSTASSSGVAISQPLSRQEPIPLSHAPTSDNPDVGTADDTQSSHKRSRVDGVETPLPTPTVSDTVVPSEKTPESSTSDLMPADAARSRVGST